MSKLCAPDIRYCPCKSLTRCHSDKRFAGAFCLTHKARHSEVCSRLFCGTGISSIAGNSRYAIKTPSFSSRRRPRWQPRSSTCASEIVASGNRARRRSTRGRPDRAFKSNASAPKRRCSHGSSIGLRLPQYGGYKVCSLPVKNLCFLPEGHIVSIAWFCVKGWVLNVNTLQVPGSL